MPDLLKRFAAPFVVAFLLLLTIASMVLDRGALAEGGRELPWWQAIVLEVTAPVAPFELEFWGEPHNWLSIVSPLALGCLLCAIACSVLGYFSIHLLWRWHVIRHLSRRRARHQRVAPGAGVAPGLNTPSSNRQI